MTPEAFGVFKSLIQAQSTSSLVQCPACHGDGLFDDVLCQLCGGQCWVEAADAEAWAQVQDEIYRGGPIL
jgi:DnaJ-class molecular chaperone